jgi:hypothetical protein
VSRRRRSKWSRVVNVVRRWAGRIGRACLLAATTCWRAAKRGLRRRGPTVIVDGRRRQGRRLRREVRRAAQTYARALGVELPPGLLVVVQRVVHVERQLNGLLQAFDACNGGRRYIVHLALSVNGRQVSDDELLAALRHQLACIVKDVVGEPVLNVPLDLEVPRARAGAPVVELRPETRARRDGQERSAMPIGRIEDERAS